MGALVRKPDPWYSADYIPIYLQFRYRNISRLSSAYVTGEALRHSIGNFSP